MKLYSPRPIVVFFFHAAVCGVPRGVLCAFEISAFVSRSADWGWAGLGWTELGQSNANDSGEFPS